MAARETQFEALGTQWRITWFDLGDVALSVLEQQIHVLLEDFDRVYSRFRPDSLVAKMAVQSGVYTMPESAGPMLELYQSLYRISQGAFTPLIGRALVDAGYDASYSLVPQRPLTHPPAWDEALCWQPPTFEVQQPVLLDFGAGGKGHGIDLVGQLSRNFGVRSFLIDGSGDFLHVTHDRETVTIGLEDPEATNQVIGTVALAGGSLCGSAGNRRTWGEYTHILNPTSLTSPRHTLATWVVADTALLADALATCLFFTPPAVLLQEFDFEYCMLGIDRSVRTSADFPGTIFTE